VSTMAMSLMLLLRGPCIRMGSLTNPSSSMVVLKMCFKGLSSFGEGSRFFSQKELVSRLPERRLVLLFFW